MSNEDKINAFFNIVKANLDNVTEQVAEALSRVEDFVEQWHQNALANVERLGGNDAKQGAPYTREKPGYEVMLGDLANYQERNNRPGRENKSVWRKYLGNTHMLSAVAKQFIEAEWNDLPDKYKTWTKRKA